MTENKEKAVSAGGEKFGSELNFAAQEAYKLLRTNVEFSFPDHERGKVIGITSPCPQEGKSYTSVNFCYALAEGGKKVLLIDGDMRRPTVSVKLGIRADMGLSDVVIGHAAFEQTVKTDVLHPGFDLLPSGNPPPNPAELIGSEQMQNILREFTGRYDYVVVDLPPVNSVSDPLIISKYLDGVIVVVKHKQTRQSDVRECIRRLRFLKVRVLGFVYNGVGGSGRSRKYGKYAHQYYRADFEPETAKPDSKQ